MASKMVWGIDVTGSSIKGVKMHLDKDGAEILEADFISLPDSGGDEEAHEEAVQHTLQSFIEKNNIKKEGIVISIPGHATFSRPVTLPPVLPKELYKIVEYEAQQYIPFPITDVVWDYHLLNPLGLEEGEDPQVMLFAVRREIIFPYLKLMNSGSFDLRALQTNPVATYNFLKYDAQPKDAVVVLDIGAEYTSLIIIHEENFWVRNLPIAGNEITKRLQKKLKISWEDAEDLKKKMSSSKQAQKIFQVIEPTLKELVGEVHRSMGYFKSQAGGVKFTDLKLLGSGANVYGLPRYFENQLQVKVDRLKSFKNIRVAADASKVLSGARLPGFTTAVGLALQGLGVASSTVNFLPKELMAIQKAAKQKPLYIVAALLAMIGVLLMALKAGDDLKLVATKGAPLKAAISNLQNINSQYDSEKDVQPTLRSLNNLLTLFPTDRSQMIKNLDNVTRLFTDNYSYPREGGKLKLDTSGDKPRIAADEKDKIYFYSITSKVQVIEGKKIRPKICIAIPKPKSKKITLSTLSVYFDGSVLHREKGSSDDKTMQWVEEQIKAKALLLFTQAGTKIHLDKKMADDNLTTLFKFRWSPQDPGKDEEQSTDDHLYLFFTVEIHLPNVGDMYRLYQDFFGTQIGGNIDELGQEKGTIESGKFAIQNICKAYAKSDITISNEDVVNVLEAYLIEENVQQLRAVLGIASDDSVE